MSGRNPPIRRKGTKGEATTKALKSLFRSFGRRVGSPDLRKAFELTPSGPPKRGRSAGNF